MQLLELNVDVLLLLTIFLERDDISRLTKTCRSLHETFAPAILEGEVRLNRHILVSFGQFMRLDSGHADPRRDFFPFLRVLTYSPVVGLRPSLGAEESVQAITNILRRSRNLVSLAIQCTAMGLTPVQLRSALSASLSALREIILDGVSSDYHDALADVSPHLNIVDLYLTQYTLGEVRQNAARALIDPLPLLQHHRSVITTLCLSHVTLDTLGEPLLSVRTLKVHDLILANNHGGWTGPLVHLFPNAEHVELGWLRTLVGSFTLNSIYRHDAATSPAAQSRRRQAKAWQAQHGTWVNGLRYLRVEDVVSLYCLGLSCRVSHLDIRELADTDSGMAAAVLADTRPRCVRFPLWSFPDATPLLRALTPSVTHLALGMRAVVEQLMVRDFLIIIEHLFEDKAISHLFVHIHDDDVPAWEEWLDGDRALVDTPPCGAVSKRALTRSPEDLLRSLVSASGTLERVFVNLGRRDLRAWERSRGAGETWGDWDRVEGLRARELMVAEGPTLAKSMYEF